MVIFILLLSVIIIKVVMNFVRLGATHYYEHKIRLLKEQRTENYKINQFSEPIGRLFNSAGAQRIIPVCKPFSDELYSDYISNQLGYVSLDELIILFERSKGVYKQRIKECFYPTYWIFFPLNILKKHGYNLKTPVKIIINLLFWLISFLAAYLLERYFDNNVIFQEWLNTLL